MKAVFSNHGIANFVLMLPGIVLQSNMIHVKNSDTLKCNRYGLRTASHKVGLERLIAFEISINEGSADMNTFFVIYDSLRFAE